MTSRDVLNERVPGRVRMERCALYKAEKRDLSGSWQRYLLNGLANMSSAREVSEMSEQKSQRCLARVGAAKSKPSYGHHQWSRDVMVSYM